jgi:hypothetical protein
MNRTFAAGTPMNVRAVLEFIRASGRVSRPTDHHRESGLSKLHDTENLTRGALEGTLGGMPLSQPRGRSA